MKRFVLAGMMLVASFLGVNAQVDPNFHIYLCFGQSNMEGNAQWETIDNKYVDPRFQMLATTKFDNPKRTMGQNYSIRAALGTIPTCYETDCAHCSFLARDVYG